MSPIGARLRRSDHVLVFAAALVFYRLTLAPTVVWGDSADLSWRAARGGFTVGTAGDHPLYLAVAWAFARLPGEIARNVNFVSALFGALTVTIVYRCARQLGGGRLAALTGAAALCVSHAFWLHSVIAEVYTANACFLSATVTLLLEWRSRTNARWLAAAALTVVLGLLNHLVLATAVPACAGFILLARWRVLFTRSRVVQLGVAAVVLMVIAVAAAPWIRPVLWRVWYGPPGIDEYLGLDFAPIETAKEAAYYLLFLGYQFPSIALPLGIAGAAYLLRRDRPAAVLLLLAIGVNAFLFIRHTVWPSASGAKYVFYIADYTLFSILIALGTQELMRWIGERHDRRRVQLAGVGVALMTAIVPPALYAVMPNIIERSRIPIIETRNLAGRDDLRYFLNPNKRGEYGARRFGEAAFAAVRPSGVLFADYTPYTVLRYLQIVEGRRPDVLVPRLRSRVVQVRWVSDDGGQPRPIYLAARPTSAYYDLSTLKGDYEIVAAGPVFTIRSKPPR